MPPKKKQMTPAKLSVPWSFEALLALRNNRDKIYNPRALELGHGVVSEAEKRALQRVRGKDRELRALVTVDDVRLSMKQVKLTFRDENYTPDVAIWETKKVRGDWAAW